MLVFVLGFYSELGHTVLGVFNSHELAEKWLCEHMAGADSYFIDRFILNEPS